MNINRRSFLKTAALGVAGVVLAPFIPLKVAVAPVVPEAAPVHSNPVPKRKYKESPAWHTADGRNIPIGRMGDGHLLNTINFLYNRGNNLAHIAGRNEPILPESYHIMVKEASRRELI